MIFIHPYYTYYNCLLTPPMYYNHLHHILYDFISIFLLCSFNLSYNLLCNYLIHCYQHLFLTLLPWLLLHNHSHYTLHCFSNHFHYTLHCILRYPLHHNHLLYYFMHNCLPIFLHFHLVFHWFSILFLFLSFTIVIYIVHHMYFLIFLLPLLQTQIYNDIFLLYDDNFIFLIHAIFISPNVFHLYMVIYRNVHTHEYASFIITFFFCFFSLCVLLSNIHLYL